MKIVALNGLLGYGYSEEALDIAFSEKVDYLGVDAGSTDPGPYYLGSGNSFTDRGAVKRDLGLALPKALEQKAPFIIGTAGGAGCARHVQRLTKEQIAKVYDIPAEKIDIIIYSVVNSIKITFPRKNISGSLKDTDIYGCQQHIPLANIEL